MQQGSSEYYGYNISRVESAASTAYCDQLDRNPLQAEISWYKEDMVCAWVGWGGRVGQGVEALLI